jgi:hypothetical protein
LELELFTVPYEGSSSSRAVQFFSGIHGSELGFSQSSSCAPQRGLDYHATSIDLPLGFLSSRFREPWSRFAMKIDLS